jgi:hypothetical protein
VDPAFHKPLNIPLQVSHFPLVEQAKQPHFLYEITFQLLTADTDPVVRIDKGKDAVYDCVD